MYDEVFGPLEHKYNFYKYEDINLFSKACNVKIVVENDENDSVLEIQQKNYKNYLKFIDENKEKIIDLIKSYFSDVYSKNIDIKKEIRPISVYFSRDGNWGILFDTRVDEENGFAIFFKDAKLSIGTQDMFI